MRRDARLARVGLTVLTALVLVAAAILLVGEQNFLFTKTNKYFVRFPTVTGLVTGNPVQLNGVIVGKVDRIILPEDMTEEYLKIWVSIERRYADRVRKDSVARIKSLGLLGDKYVDISSGSPGFERILVDEEIPAAPPTDVDRLISSGEGVLENVLATASSLSKILGRMERGEGLLGELLTEREDGKSVANSVISTLESIDSVAQRIEDGHGTLGRLINDNDLADSIEQTIVRLGDLTTQIERGEGLLPSLLTDAATKQRFDSILDSVEETSTGLSTLARELEGGDGLLPKLINDEEFGSQITSELQDLLETLNQLAGSLQSGDGTAARLIQDPAVYEAVNDILIGINESKLLRWLIRNRQKKGIEKRYEDAQETAPTPEIPVSPN
jgi:phospholipid/cholesterol/gamma-HCH transport system substrate-binding protein